MEKSTDEDDRPWRLHQSKLWTAAYPARNRLKVSRDLLQASVVELFARERLALDLI